MQHDGVAFHAIHQWLNTLPDGFCDVRDHWMCQTQGFL
ncbi:Uncharacterised protein [Vibrio cholerae]|nr:Uncharacterised protein [Vibrio cholerae]CSI94461.1 Uncharacterised protein [Vibrio cholerae]